MPVALAGTMTRTASKTTVAPGGQFYIIYDSVTKNPIAWDVDEGFQSGFKSTPKAIGCSETWDPVDNIVLKCRLRFGDSPLPYKLNVTAPTQAGTYVLNDGRYALWTDSTDSVEHMTGFINDLTIIVSGTPTGCSTYSDCSGTTPCCNTTSQTCIATPSVAVTSVSCAASGGCGALLDGIGNMIGTDNCLFAGGALVVGGFMAFMVIMMLMQMMMGMTRR